MKVDIEKLHQGAWVMDDNYNPFVVTEKKDIACNLFSGELVYLRSLKQPLKFTSPQEIVW